MVTTFIRPRKLSYVWEKDPANADASSPLVPGTPGFFHSTINVVNRTVDANPPRAHRTVQVPNQAPVTYVSVLVSNEAHIHRSRTKKWARKRAGDFGFLATGATAAAGKVVGRGPPDVFGTGPLWVEQYKQNIQKRTST